MFPEVGTDEIPVPTSCRAYRWRCAPQESPPRETNARIGGFLIGGEGQITTRQGEEEHIVVREIDALRADRSSVAVTVKAHRRGSSEPGAPWRSNRDGSRPSRSAPGPGRAQRDPAGFGAVGLDEHAAQRTKALANAPARSRRRAGCADFTAALEPNGYADVYATLWLIFRETATRE